MTRKEEHTKATLLILVQSLPLVLKLVWLGSLSLDFNLLLSEVPTLIESGKPRTPVPDSLAVTFLGVI